MPRSLSRRQRCSGFRPLQSRIATRLPASCAPTLLRKDAEKIGGLRVVIGARLDLEDAPSLLVYPKDRAAYGRLCRLLSLGQGRAEKGKCILRLADVAAHAEGQIFIALPPNDWDWRKVQSEKSRRARAGRISKRENFSYRYDTLSA